MRQSEQCLEKQLDDLLQEIVSEQYKVGSLGEEDSSSKGDSRILLESVEEREENLLKADYPCLVLVGAETEEEIDFLKLFSTERTDSRAIHLYCEASQGTASVGLVHLDLSFLLTLSRMPGYRLFLLRSEKSSRKEIQIQNPNELLRFL